jgi:serine protease DegQ
VTGKRARPCDWSSRLGIALLAVIVVAAGSGCDRTSKSGTAAGKRSGTAAGSPSSTSSPSPPALGHGPDGLFSVIPGVVRKLQPSVVTILTGTGLGSGVIWSTDGILPPALFADGLPQVGALAIAIGSPLGFEETVTAGIISGTQRSIPGSGQQTQSLVDLLQTDAPISPGNSGGALVDADGKVIGLNEAYLPPATGAVSIGFAIPSSTVRDVVEQLLKTGHAQHAYLGLRLGELTPEIAGALRRTTGALVLDVEAGGPAAKAGIQPGDVIIRFDNAKVATVEDVLTALRHHQPGDEVNLAYDRNGQHADVKVRLTERPAQR